MMELMTIMIEMKKKLVQTTIAYIVIRTEQFLVMFSLLTLVLAKKRFYLFHSFMS